MIPEAAVEAAAKAAYELKPTELFGREHPITWEQLSDSPLGQRCKENELATARAALEAAAPHMLAAAFEEAAEAFGEAASWSDSNPSPEQVQRWLRSRANPYRHTP